MEYRFIALQHSIEVYGGDRISARRLGIWRGLKLTRKSRSSSNVSDAGEKCECPPGDLLSNEERLHELAGTKRGLEILELIAHGLVIARLPLAKLFSNRIAGPDLAFVAV